MAQPVQVTLRPTPDDAVLGIGVRGALTRRLIVPKGHLFRVHIVQMVMSGDAAWLTWHTAPADAGFTTRRAILGDQRLILAHFGTGTTWREFPLGLQYELPPMPLVMWLDGGSSGGQGHRIDWFGEYIPATAREVREAQLKWLADT